MDTLGLFMLLILLFFQWTPALAAEEITWTYSGLVGQSEWSEYFPDCGGTSQSPVDVMTTQAKYDPSLIPVTPLGYSQHGNQPFTMYNNGHTVVIELPEWMGLGGLPWFFTAIQMHLHWGNDGPSLGGSEHTINGLSADAELHVVHYNSELYPNMSAAMTQKDGLAVLGILIVTGEETNPAFNNILNYLSRIRHAGKSSSTSTVFLKHIKTRKQLKTETHTGSKPRRKSVFLKTEIDGACLASSYSSFHILGAKAAKALSPLDL
ncbi:carbonic anhydrase 14-like [Neolamprologus brichardi]|uniref:carbonic anhydrase 14-like n=1 Tax=Neolamprologus brichardi TaxID=32507 RepID=UPI0003EC554B|nr:carbonic anhydrase 14-like [Neolamprologus brichardi]